MAGKQYPHFSLLDKPAVPPVDKAGTKRRAARGGALRTWFGERSNAPRGGLRHRRREPEWMDQPDLDRDEHRRALLGLGRVNWISRTVAHVWPAIEELAQGRASRPVRVLDIACGGGDVALQIARQARSHGLRVDVAGCDLSRTAVAFAREQAGNAGWENVQFFPTDVLKDPLPTDYDVLTCGLFLHHLDQQQAIALLGRMADATRDRVVVSDLRRSRAGYALAWIGCRLLTRSPIVHVDGPRSVAAAFTIDEMKQLADASRLTGARIFRRWPQRQVLVWRRARRKE